MPSNYYDVVISQSVADMKTEMPTGLYMIVLIGDNPVPNDGRVRFYVFDAASVAVPNDDSVIKPNSPLFNTTGRWIKVLTPTFANIAFSGSYNDLINKPTIPSAVVVGPPNTRSVSLATAYQATDPTKPAMVTISVTSTAGLTLGGGTTNSADLLIGATSAVATGTGTAIGKYLSSLTGTLVIGVAINNGQTTTYTLPLPAGWYFAVRQTSGSVSVVNAFDQSIGL